MRKTARSTNYHESIIAIMLSVIMIIFGVCALSFLFLGQYSIV